MLIKRLGRKNMTVAILRESLLSLSRLIPYVRQGAEEWLTNGSPVRLKQVDRDLRSLSAYEAQLSSEIVYLHDATLGLINLEQNRIIKVFSIAAVLFLPPTLVGTIYGMNFEVMPELQWAFGYPVALGLMVLSADCPTTGSSGGAGSSPHPSGRSPGGLHAPPRARVAAGRSRLGGNPDPIHAGTGADGGRSRPEAGGTSLRSDCVA